MKENDYVREDVSKQEISLIISMLGVPQHLMGFDYLVKAIQIVLRNPEFGNKMERYVYKRIAVITGGEKSVSQCIFNAIKAAWPMGDKILQKAILGEGGKNEAMKKPSSKEFIIAVANFLRVER